MGMTRRTDEALQRFGAGCGAPRTSPEPYFPPTNNRATIHTNASRRESFARRVKRNGARGEMHGLARATCCPGARSAQETIFALLFRSALFQKFFDAIQCKISFAVNVRSALDLTLDSLVFGWQKNTCLAIFRHTRSASQPAGPMLRAHFHSAHLVKNWRKAAGTPSPSRVPLFRE